MWRRRVWRAGAPIVSGRTETCDAGCVESVEAVYRRLLVENRVRVERERRRHLWLGYGKLADFLLGVIAAGVLVHTRGPFLLLLIPLAIFIVLIVVHDRVLRRLGRYERVTDFYARGLARLEDQWAGTGETGDRFFDPAHPYARDLDLFGKGSLFELLSTARTRAGEETLARWLLAAAGPDEVRARQAAVLDMKDRVQLRERLFTAGEHVRAGVHPEALAAWGEGRASFTTGQLRWLPWVLALLAVLWVASMMAWIASLLAGDVTRNLDPAILMSLINYSVSKWLERRVSASADAVEKAAEDLRVLREVLEVMEGETFAADRLLGLRASMEAGHGAPSVAVKKLERIYDWLEDRRNKFVQIFDAFVFYTAQFTMAAERWRAQYGPAIRGWLEAVGEFEALAALAGYAYEHPADTMPELVEERPWFETEGLAHPLLPLEKAVGNDLTPGAYAAAHDDQRAEYGGQEHVSARGGAECGAGAVRGSGAGETAADVAGHGGRVNLRTGFAAGRSFAILCGDSEVKGAVGFGGWSGTGAVLCWMNCCRGRIRTIGSRERCSWCGSW